MEPKHVAPNARLEAQPTRPVEVGHEQNGPRAEYAGFSGAERRGEKTHELGAVQAEVAQAAIPSLPAPIVPLAQDDATATAQTDDVPLVAGDDDLIEKEWVDKAKKILADTRDDPYRREQEVSRLQIEYIRKRYGREIGGLNE